VGSVRLERIWEERRKLLQDSRDLLVPTCRVNDYAKRRRSYICKLTEGSERVLSETGIVVSEADIDNLKLVCNIA
jgi:hypothetical protein